MAKNLPANEGDARSGVLITLSGRSLGEGNGWLLILVLLLGEFHGQRSLVW